MLSSGDCVRRMVDGSLYTAAVVDAANKMNESLLTVLEELKKKACTAAGVDDANKVNESEAKLTERNDAAAIFGKSHYTDAAFVQDSQELMMEQAHVNYHRLQNSLLFLDQF